MKTFKNQEDKNPKSVSIITIEAESGNEYFDNGTVYEAVPEDMIGKDGFIKMSKLDQAVTFIDPLALSMMKPNHDNYAIFKITGGVDSKRQIKLNIIDSKGTYPDKVIDVKCNGDKGTAMFHWTESDSLYHYDKIVIKSDADISDYPLEIDNITFEVKGNSYSFNSIDIKQASKVRVTFNDNDDEVLEFESNVSSENGAVTYDVENNKIVFTRGHPELNYITAYLEDEKGNREYMDYNGKVVKVTWTDEVWTAGFMSSDQKYYPSVSFKIATISQS